MLTRRRLLALGQLGGGGVAPPAAFVGAMDAYTTDLVALYGPSRLLSSYTGALVRLRRDTDDAEADFGYVEATGALDTDAISAWLGGATGYRVTWYDQSGAGKHATQTTASVQPTNSASNVTFNGSDQRLVTGVAPTATYAMIVRFTGLTRGLAKTIAGSQATNCFFNIKSQAAATTRFSHGKTADVGDPDTSGVYAIAPGAGYKNGALVAAPSGSWDGTPLQVYIGCNAYGSGGGTPFEFTAVTVVSLGIWSSAPQVAAISTIMAGL